jgi:hypothetical protein
MNTYTHLKLKFDENAWEDNCTAALRILALQIAFSFALDCIAHFQALSAIAVTLSASLLATLTFAHHLYTSSPVIIRFLIQLLVASVGAVLVTAHLEYFAHRFLMHATLVKNEWFRKFSKNHLIHHEVYGVGHYDHPLEKYADQSHVFKGKPLRFFGLTSCTKYPMLLGVPFEIAGLFLHWWLFCLCLLPLLLCYTPFFNLFHECTHNNWKPTCLPDWFYWRICYQHLLHHNHHRNETHGNYGVMFLSVCDRLYGTHVAPSEQDNKDWSAFRERVRTKIVPADREKAKEKCWSE